MMKNLLTFFMMICTCAFLQAQINVTLSVDASNETVDATGVHVAGNWDADNEWNPPAYPMTDDGNGVWSITISVAENSTFEYKYILGNDWMFPNEAIDGEAGCIAGNGNSNRILSVGAADMTIPAVCYNQCGPCAGMGESSVTFKVDLSEEDPVNSDSIYVAGSFTMWADGQLRMRDDNGDGIYTVTATIPNGDIQYKFKNGPEGWEGVSGACTDGGNRVQTISETTNLETACFGKCGPCVVTNTLNVIFKLDMSLEADLNGISSLGVHMAGNFQGKAGLGGDWTPKEATLTDDDGDLIYELTVRLPEGDYEFKYLNGDDWGTEESVPQDCVAPGSGNRALKVEGDQDATIEVGPICFGSCSAMCPVLGDPINVTFRVDMTNEFVSGDGLFVSGDFFIPKWKKDTLKLTEDTDNTGLWTYTHTLRPGLKYAYKFFNGGEAGEEGGDLLPCGVDNGFGGSNRLLDLENVSEDFSTPIYVFGSCDISTNFSSTNELSTATKIEVAPNPFSSETVISFDNPLNATHNLTLTAITGQQVKMISQIVGNQVIVQKDDLTPGVYFATLQNEKGEAATFRLIVQ